MEQIQIIGNLAADARLVEPKIPGAEPFIAFTVMVNEKRGDSETKTAYNVTCRNGKVFDHLRTGKAVFVQGRPSVDAYMAQDGTPKARITVRADMLRLL